MHEWLSLHLASLHALHTAPHIHLKSPLSVCALCPAAHLHLTGPACLPAALRYALGVLDKSTGKMRLAEIEGGRPIRLTCKPSELSLSPTQAGADEEVGRATEQARKQR